jgi:DhnA family fructose-bisphosphate aldolase class Ia
MTLDTHVAASGHTVRLRRILRPRTRRTLIIPLDHASVTGPVPGLVDARRIVADAAEAGADAVLLRPGMMGAVTETESRGLGIIAMLTGRLARGVDHVLLNTVEHAVRCGADAVCAEFKLGSLGDLENARIVSQVVEAAARFALPCLMTIYALPEYVAAAGTGAYTHACRLGEELGADLIKTSLPADPEVIRACVAACRVPIVVAGGVEGAADSLVEGIRMAVELGVAGAAIGRNVWGHRDPVAMARRLRSVIHGDVA